MQRYILGYGKYEKAPRLRGFLLACFSAEANFNHTIDFTIKKFYPGYKKVFQY